MEKNSIVPDFSFRDQHGESNSFHELLKSGPVVLSFYPKAKSLVCTRQSCRLRDLKQEFAEFGAKIIGVSSDTQEQQKEFDDAHDLGFPLITDTDGKVGEIFGVKRKGSLPHKRVTFVVDSDGKVLASFRSELRGNFHADSALEFLRKQKVS